MNRQFSGLYFPETIAQYPSFSQLLLFFDSISQLLPAEDSATPDLPLVREGLLQQHVPLPFGEEGLASFNKLICDLQGHGNAFFNSYLSSLSNSAAIDIDEASVWNLIGKMAPQSKSAAPDQQDTLFQARLLLKLAEIKTQEQAEINRQMETLQAKNSSLFSELKGELPSASLAGLLAAENSESPNRFRQRFKAWTHLFLADSNETPWLALTCSQDVIESLQESAGDLAVREPLFELPLADLSANCEDQDLAARLQAFKTAHSDFLTECHLFLSKTAGSNEITKFTPTESLMSQWQDAVNSLDGAKASLQFFGFRMPLDQLFQENCRIHRNQPLPKTTYNNAVIGLIQQT